MTFFISPPLSEKCPADIQKSRSTLYKIVSLMERISFVFMMRRRTEDVTFYIHYRSTTEHLSASSMCDALCESEVTSPNPLILFFGRLSAPSFLKFQSILFNLQSNDMGFMSSSG